MRVLSSFKMPKHTAPSVFLPSLFLSSLLFIQTALAGPMVDLGSQQELDQYLSKNKFNGVLLVEKDGKTIMRKAYGVADFETNTPLKETDRFQIGSVTKQFVAAAILKLQENKKINISEELDKYIPGLPASANIKDALNHSAGISNYTDEKDFWKDVDNSKILSIDDLLSRILKLKPKFPPRAQFEYSNSGYIVAGKLIETASGLTWDKFISREFLKPLGMDNTGYSEYFNRVSPVVGHVQNEQGDYRPFGLINLSWALSAGALYSNVDDLAKWMSIYDSSPLLTEESKTLMQTPYKNGFALGIMVDKFNDQTRIRHNGRTPGFVSEVSYLKESKLKVISLDNVDGSSAPAGSLALSLFSQGKTLGLKMNKYTMDSKVLNDYVGEYADSKMKVELIVERDTLILKTVGQKPHKLTPNDKDSFRLAQIAGEEFLRNEKGEVVTLRHYQNGRIFDFKRVK